MLQTNWQSWDLGGGAKSLQLINLITNLYILVELIQSLQLTTYLAHMTCRRRQNSMKTSSLQTLFVFIRLLL